MQIVSKCLSTEAFDSDGSALGLLTCVYDAADMGFIPLGQYLNVLVTTSSEPKPAFFYQH